MADQQELDDGFFIYWNNFIQELNNNKHWGCVVCKSADAAVYVRDKIMKQPTATIEPVVEIAPYIEEWLLLGATGFWFVDDDFQFSWNEFPPNDGSHRLGRLI